MRVLRGYNYDGIMVIDGVGYHRDDIACATDKELEDHGCRYPSLARPPWFTSGSPYADGLNALIARHKIKGFKPPVDMESAMVFNDGKRPALFPAFPTWSKVFNLDPALYYFATEY